MSCVHFGDGPKAIHFVIATGLPVVLHEREGLFPVNPEPFEDQILTIIGPAHQRLLRICRMSRPASASGSRCYRSLRNPDTSAG